MKNKLHGMLTLLLAFVVQFTFAQEKVVTGTVIDEDGLPLPGVNVIEKGTTNGTQTNFDGEYSLSVDVGAVVTFSYVGFGAQEITVGQADVYNITLRTDAAALSEVVVVGYGTRDKTNVVGSVAQVSGEVLEDRPSPNVLDALQGQVSGLQIFTSSGEPNAIPSIRLRGVGSLGAGSTPLILLDGFQVDPGVFTRLNPNDIQDITVLKDASETAIYGSRAANGVVVITTKTGRKEQDPEISVGVQHGFSNLANTDFFEGVMNTEQLTNFWVDSGIYTQDQINSILSENNADTEWYKYYYKEDAPTTQVNLSARGGSKKTSYFLSAGYFEQEGLAFRSNFDRITLRSNLTTEINDWLSTGLNVPLAYSTDQENPYGSNSTNRGLALLAQPFYSPINPETGERYEGVIPGWNRYDPMYLANNNPYDRTRFQINPSAFVELSPIEGLSLKSAVGIDAYDERITSERLPSFVGSLNDGSRSESFRRDVLLTISNTAQYDFNLGNDGVHDVSALIGHEFTDYDRESFSASSTGQSDDRLTMLGQGPNNRDVGQTIAEYSLESFFGRLTYSFNEKYYLNLTLREDGSSRFGRDNRKAQFWAVGSRWNAINEDFFSNISWLDNLVLRASIGTSGNSDIGNYNSYALVGTNQYQGKTGWSLATPGNPALQWESQQTAQVGVEVGLFDRVRLSVEYYDRLTENMLIDVPYPFTTGFSEVTENTGSLKNYGFDLALDFDVVKDKDWSITPYVNFNYNQNKVTELFQGRDYWIIPNTGVSWSVGEPLSFFYPVFAGINPENGDAEWYLPNENPDEIVNNRQDPNNVTNVFNTAALQQNTGIDRYPPLNGGFGLRANYKDIYFESHFAFSSGKYLINNDRYFYENPFQFPGFNQSERILDYWQEPGDESLFPRAGVQFTQFDSRLIEDASFIRLKNITLGYNLSPEILNATGFVKGAKVYITGRNLLTFTDYLGPDPEVDSNLGLGTNPNTEQIVFGVDLQF
ncbi:SusC/RagA family TonB-linked outer membrane protein [Salegentibacter maritimus]|uniref:SusC/RagA family TonB-linked outer membrane protein n=1 Tax=Salegentibacter maritimus TaxID=2794347 RepID=UPI0018E4B123|nr:TonB-dependent receptor [Salegentibacter maritimus]MBI6116966.1 TonB-dependent receptor [Salegentibacter maritimus]